MKAIKALLEANNSLKELNLCNKTYNHIANNYIGDEGIILLADSLKVNTSIVTLNLGIYNSINYSS